MAVVVAFVMARIWEPPPAKPEGGPAKP